MMRTAIRCLPLLALLALTGCSGRRHVQVGVDSFHPLRRYGFTSSVVDPVPAWRPSTYRIVVRTNEGLALLDEGTGRQQYYRNRDLHDVHELVWRDRDHLLIAPTPPTKRDRDGQPLMPVEAVRELPFEGNRPTELSNLPHRGYQPRPLRDGVLMGWREELRFLDRYNNLSLFDHGFNAEPEPRGDGAAWNTVPVVTPDWWTDRQDAGELVVRWRSGRIDLLPLCLQPAWGSDGRLYATRLRRNPDKPEQWREAGTDVVVVDGWRQAPRVLALDAHGAQPHPWADVVAVERNDGSVHLVGSDGSTRQLSAKGRRPRWSPDGYRLLIEETGAGLPYLAVTVFRIADREGILEANEAAAEQVQTKGSKRSEDDGAKATDRPGN